MADETQELDLGDRGGQHVFRSYEQIQRWIADERTRWEWLADSSFTDHGKLRSWVFERLNWLQNSVEGNRQQGHALTGPIDAIRQVFVDHPQAILHSQSDLGRRVLDIYNAEGVKSAAYAYGLATRRFGIAAGNEIEDLRGAIMLAVPATMAPQTIAEQLSRERRNLRARADKLLGDLEAAEDERRAAFAATQRKGRRQALRWISRRFGRWKAEFEAAAAHGAEVQRRYVEQALKTQAEFDATKALYHESMRLQAPVAYWEGKAKQHKTAEARARGWLLFFFPVAILLLGAAFGGTSYWLLTHSVKDPPTALFIIVSGGLATVAGLSFWVGRLLTKLYLSEHHLRHDAEERAVMTTTYLALTKEKAADEVDRHIILTALFRSTPDGIVKDDGPGDLSIPMLLSRLGAGGKS